MFNAAGGYEILCDCRTQAEDFAAEMNNGVQPWTPGPQPDQCDGRDRNPIGPDTFIDPNDDLAGFDGDGERLDAALSDPWCSTDEMTLEELKACERRMAEWFDMPPDIRWTHHNKPGTDRRQRPVPLIFTLELEG